MKHHVHLIASQDRNRNIGYWNELLYRIPEDIAYFRAVTTSAPPGKKNVVVMGSATWLSIPKKFRPLPNRINFVITRNPHRLERPEDVHFCPTWGCCLSEIRHMKHIHDIFVIGGAYMFKTVLETEYTCVETVFMTNIDFSLKEYSDSIEEDKLRKFPDVNLVLVHESEPRKAAISVLGEPKDVSYRFCIYRTMQISPTVRGVWGEMGIRSACAEMTQERQYLDLLRKTLGSDLRRGRNGNTYSIFGARMEFDVRSSVPLLTTKRVAWKTVIKELLWFVRGDTSNQSLQREGVHIWDANSTRDFLDSRGLFERPEGDLGPVYGFQWRHFGAEYRNCDSNYGEEGVDQLAEILKLLKNEPHSRRMIMSAWNPSDLDKMALPPCHLLCQFYVEKDNLLSLQLYQRSGDAFLGVPFNIFSYTVLLYMVSHVMGYQPHKVIHIIGDFHIYEDHVEAVHQQLARTPLRLPQLEIINKVDHIENFTVDDFKLENYAPHPSIKAKMAA